MPPSEKKAMLPMQGARILIPGLGTKIPRVQYGQKIFKK